MRDDHRDLLIDVSRLIWRVSSGRLPTGIDRVCLAYVAQYHRRAQAVVQWGRLRRILSPGASDALFDLLLTDRPHFRRDVIRLVPRSLPRLLVPRSGGNRLYLNIGHSGLDQPGLSDWIRRAQVRPVFMLHDLIPVTHPDYCRPGSREKHEKRLDLMLGTASGIIGNSQDTLDILKAYADAHDRPIPPTVASWLGATPLPPPTGEPPLSGPYFVVLGTIEGRKNHLLLLRIWKELIARHGPAAPRLVIIGQRGWEADDVFAMLDGDEGLRGHVTELPRCTDTELGGWLRGARALLFPSFAEGYGMPLVEALGHGTPVIASDLKVFRELAGDIPDYLAPEDTAGWLSAVARYAAADSSDRSQQMTRMAAYHMPDWPGHFATVDGWLPSLD
jgi:glycosyltransferase involved in cell wall biosynthesis